MIVHIDNKKMTFATGVKVESKFWDAVDSKIKTRHEQASDLNLP